MKFEHRVAKQKWDMLQDRGAKAIGVGEDWICFLYPPASMGIIDSWGKVKWSTGNGDIEDAD